MSFDTVYKYFACTLYLVTFAPQTNFMKLANIALTGLCITLIVFASCKKHNNPSVSDNLVGTWKATYTATDTNGNGIMDPNERMVDTADANFRLVFNANGTLALTLFGTPIAQSSWSLINSNTYLKTVDTGSAGTTTIQHIDNLTSSSLTLKDTTGGTATWTIFAKQ